MKKHLARALLVTALVASSASQAAGGGFLQSFLGWIGLANNHPCGSVLPVCSPGGNCGCNK